MSDLRRHPRAIKPSSTEGDVLTTTGGVAAWGPPAAATGVQSVVAGDGVMVDATDPMHPVVAAPIRELLMADGVTSPPVPIETEAGDDWLYED